MNAGRLLAFLVMGLLTLLSTLILSGEKFAAIHSFIESKGVKETQDKFLKTR